MFSLFFLTLLYSLCYFLAIAYLFAFVWKIASYSLKRNLVVGTGLGIGIGGFIAVLSYRVWNDPLVEFILGSVTIFILGVLIIQLLRAPEFSRVVLFFFVFVSMISLFSKTVLVALVNPKPALQAAWIAAIVIGFIFSYAFYRKLYRYEVEVLRGPCLVYLSFLFVQFSVHALYEWLNTGFAVRYDELAMALYPFSLDGIYGRWITPAACLLSYLVLGWEQSILLRRKTR